MKKILSFLSVILVIFNIVILSVACSTQIKKIDLLTKSNEIQKIINDENHLNKPWVQEEIQEKIDLEFGTNAILVYSEQFTKSNKSDKWIFKGSENLIKNKYKYIGEINLYHEWQNFKVLAIDIQTAANEAAGDYETLEAAHKAIEKEVLGVTGVESVNFGLNDNYAWTSGQVKFSIKLEKDYELDGENSFTVDVRTGSNILVKTTDIQIAANEAAGDYETLEKAHQAIENAVSGVAGVESVNFEINNYAWIGQQVKFSVKLEKDYELDGENTFAVDIRTGSNILVKTTDIQSAADIAKGDYETLEAAHKAIEKEVLGVTGVESVNFWLNDYVLTEEQVKFSVKLEKDYELDGENSFTVDVRINRAIIVKKSDIQNQINNIVKNARYEYVAREQIIKINHEGVVIKDVNWAKVSRGYVNVKFTVTTALANNENYEWDDKSFNGVFEASTNTIWELEPIYDWEINNYIVNTIGPYEPTQTSFPTFKRPSEIVYRLNSQNLNQQKFVPSTSLKTIQKWPGDDYFLCLFQIFIGPKTDYYWDKGMYEFYAYCIFND
ncbi:hypothetical protein [Mesoplasma florum]|uniref:hypothetical protein n=1 Tax=Mesoplasma florum TaxID=2151 RepID=UPI000D08EB38|nr:hypothetical protein [Mesoplasma florum]AVN60800.1 hypothetical protein CG005_00595 [Mesoplasma florum]